VRGIGGTMQLVSQPQNNKQKRQEQEPKVARSHLFRENELAQQQLIQQYQFRSGQLEQMQQ
jgi:hypothetical protein